MDDLLIGAAATVDIAPAAPGPETYANARLVLHRSAVLTTDKSGGLALDDTAIAAWAVATNLGQGPDAGRPRSGMVRAGTTRAGQAGDRRSGDARRAPAHDDAGLLAAVARRRAEAVDALIRRNDDVRVYSVTLEARGALITGTGDAGIRDVGIHLDGTYGWPILAGGSLKGAAREYARQAGLPQPEIDRIFGTEPKAPEGVPGSVAFFDALPGPDGVQVTAHVLTPHTRGYRSAADSTTGPAAPGEFVNPVPIPFLAIERGRFVTYLAGPEPQVGKAGELLGKAAADLGLGAKTASGYGYMTASVSSGSVRATVTALTPGAETDTPAPDTRSGSTRGRKGKRR